MEGEERHPGKENQQGEISYFCGDAKTQGHWGSVRFPMEFVLANLDNALAEITQLVI